jgi:carbohydrate diacid regulator
MITNQIIQNSIDDLKVITRVDLAVYDLEGQVLARTGEEDTDPELIRSFVDSPADSEVIGGKHLLKVYEDSEALYILVATGNSDDAYMVAKIAVSQLQALNVAYRERYDKNSFYQNLILDNMLLVDIYNRAKKLRIEANAPRAVFLIEAKTDEGIAVELLRGLYTPQSGDAVTSVDENSIILIKTLKDTTPAALEEVAHTVVSLLNTEAMLSTRVAYGTVVQELKDVSKSYKEAKMALEVGQIFYAGKNVIAYTTLGIGRLIYQLPVNLCEIFINEIFANGIPEELDEETRNTLDKFFENNLNVSETSRQLFVHRNTLVYRIEKVQKATGLDLRCFDDALTFKIAMMVESYLNFMKHQG